MNGQGCVGKFRSYLFEGPSEAQRVLMSVENNIKKQKKDRYSCGPILVIGWAGKFREKPYGRTDAAEPRVFFLRFLEC